MEEYGLRGTFYLKPAGENWRADLAPWRNVAQAGHEIGNHTLSHICSRNFGWNGRSLETMTLAEIEADILEAEKRLRELIPEQEVRTFCYPCYQNYVGEGQSRKSYVPVVAKHFPAARGMGEAANHPLYTDMHYLASWTAAGWMSGDDLCGFVKDAIRKERWCILTFHDVQDIVRKPWVPGDSYHGSPVTTESFRELCAFLAANRDVVWTAPVLDVAQNIISWRRGIGDRESVKNDG